ncbi:MAG: hypothetical protein LC676_14280 [Loktanella sp.]|nr:hypothetical protein [Loktanella sp.]
MAKFNFKISQIYPGAGEHKLNTCGNPDCVSFGKTLTDGPQRVADALRRNPDLTPAQLEAFEQKGPGAYKLAGADKKYRRVSRVFEYQDKPHEWIDQRTIRCKSLVRDNTVCNSGFSILSQDHLDEEISRLRNHNGVLDGPACGVCGTRFLACPDQFTMKGAHQRTKDSKGQPIEKKGAPRAVRVLHKPCKGKTGARITIALPHEKQKTTKDNLRILNALLNSAGILDVQRMLGTAGTGKKIGISRIYDRIAWFEQVFLAYEREMLRRWKEKVEKSGKRIEHRLSHDDLSLTVNWETATDPRNTQLNCAITADARSGYVYRLDVDFDPRVAPLDLFNRTYLDEQGRPQNLSKDYPGTEFGTAPLFSWQRRTGRLHEPQFFSACVNELEAFRVRARRRMPRKLADQRAVREELTIRIESEMERIRLIGEEWFGFRAKIKDSRGSFKGMTTRDTYTKAAHFVLLKEMLPAGEIVLTTEKEATLPAILPHIFEDEIRQDRFTWLAMTFNKKAVKPEIVGKVKKYRGDRWQFHNDGMYEGHFDPETDAQTVSQAFIAKHMKVATRGSKSLEPFPTSNYRIPAFPKIWIRSPTQASGELDKIVGFPVVPTALRIHLKSLPFNATELGEELREELAELVWKATLQPASTFMNSVRERLSAARRAGSGGARVGNSYIQGAIFNPKTLISLLNIFRVHYNFFEPRPYASPFAEDSTLTKQPKVMPRALRIPGTKELIQLTPRARRTPERKTPAMRHGIDAYVRRKNGNLDVPDLHRLIYRPWLYANTKVGTKLDRTWGAASKKKPTTPLATGTPAAEQDITNTS